MSRTDAPKPHGPAARSAEGSPVNPVATLIAEDEHVAAEALADWVKATPSLSLAGICPDGEAALARIRELRPGLVLMDIRMPGMSGLDVVRALQDEGLQGTAVIFTTAYDEHALTAFELHAVDYLLKPFSRDRFDEAVAHALARRGEPPPADAFRPLPAQPLTRILVRDRGAIVPLPVDAIEYLQSDTKYTSIASQGRSFLVRLPLTSFEERLDPQRFVKVQRGCIVNLEFVDSMKPNANSQLVVHMRGGMQITASREISRKLREQTL
jgi:two-component system LytT family response regulator